MSIYVSLYPSIHPPTHPSVYLSIYPPIYLPLCPSTYPSIYLPLRLLCGCADPFSPWGPLKFHLIQSKLTVKKWDTLKTSGKKGEGWVREEGGAGFLFFIFFSGWMLARAACSEVEECNVLFFKGPSRWRVDRKVPEKPAPNEWGGMEGEVGGENHLRGQETSKKPFSRLLPLPHAHFIPTPLHSLLAPCISSSSLIIPSSIPRP